MFETPQERALFETPNRRCLYNLRHKLHFENIKLTTFLTSFSFAFDCSLLCAVLIELLSSSPSTWQNAIGKFFPGMAGAGQKDCKRGSKVAMDTDGSVFNFFS